MREFIFDLQRFKDIFNERDVVTVNGGAGNDYLYNSEGWDVTINGCAGDDTIDNYRGWYAVINGGVGNDSIYNKASNSTIDGGTGDDTIRLGYADLVAYSAEDGNDKIYGFKADSTLSISGGSYSTTKSGKNIIVTVGEGKITLVGAASLSAVNIDGTEGGDSKLITLTDGNDTYKNTVDGATIQALGGKDTVKNYADSVFVDGGTGNDHIYNGDSQDEGGLNVTIKGGAGSDTIELWDTKTATVYGDAGDDFIDSSSLAQKILLNGGAGNDSIVNPGSNVTINAGVGNDYIYNKYYTSNGNLLNKPGNYGENVLFEYSLGDGNDKIYGFMADSTLSIGGSAYSTKKSGDNIIVTVGDGKISLIGAASLSAVNIKGKETVENSWTISGTTAKYGTSKKTLVTVKGVKSLDGLSINDNVVTVAKASLNAKTLTISKGYTLALADEVDKPTTKKAAWMLNNSTATYKSSGKTAGYTLASNKKSITYSKATTVETLATIKGVKSTDGLKVSSGKITLKNSALKNKVTVSGGYEFDFASDYKSATITGSKNSNTITARGKKIKINSGNGDDVIKIFGSGTVTGGNGADIFAYKSSGANVISDYNSEDKISIASGKVNITTSSDDVILNGKITVKGGANKTVTYIENGIEKTFKNVADDVIYSDDGTSATLTTRYTADNFTPSDYSKYKDTLLTIDASAVDYNLKIEGNKRANKIIGTGEDDYIDGAGGKDTIWGGDGKDTLVGGAGNDCLHGGIGNDSLWGGAGDDTLFGGDGDDIFVYKDGDDNDIIADFDSVDKIMVLSELGDYNVNGSDVTFEVGRGKILIQNGADKNIELVDGYGNHLKHYSPKS